MIAAWMAHLRLQSFRAPLCWGLAAGLFTALLTLFMPNQYKSEARILPADARGTSGLGNLAAAAAAVGVTIPGQESADAVYVDILNSRSLRETLLTARYSFKVRTWYFGGEQRRDQTLEEYLHKRNRDRALKALKKYITVSRDLKTKLLTVTVETESPELSQQMVQRLVKFLDEFVVTKSRTKGGAKAEFAAKRLEEARQEMTQAEDALRVFLESNRNYQGSSDPRVRLRGVRLESEFKLRTQIVSTLAIAREQALMEEKNDIPILNVLDSGDLPIEKNAPVRSQIVLLGTLSGGFIAYILNRYRINLLGSDVTTALAVPYE